MDIFLRNINDQASDKSLEKALRKQLAPFRIDLFTCRKLRKRGCGLLTVLDSRKAENFLSYYGTQSRNSLNFMGRKLICSKSNAQPNPIFLRTLRQEMEERRSYTGQLKLKHGRDPTADRQYQYMSIQCGVWDYQGADLVFLPHAECRRPGWIKFGKKNLALVADEEGSHDYTYRLDISYAAIHSITVGESCESTITLNLFEAPKAYHRSSNVPALFGRLSLLGNPINPSQPEKFRVPGLWGDQDTVIKSCFVYRVIILHPTLIHRIDKMLQRSQEMPRNIRWPTPTLPTSFEFSQQMEGLQASLKQCYLDLDFTIKFQIQRLAVNGVVSPEMALRLLPHVLQLFGRSGRFAAEDAVRRLHTRVPYAGPDTENTEFTIDTLKDHLQRFEKASKREEARSLFFKQHHSHIVFIRRAEITPACVYLRGPEPETSNRVLRTYAEHIDYFIRVTFCEEDGGQIRFDRSVSLERIFHARFKGILNDGFRIAGRHFTFLGFSHSSLRDQTCWFMAPFEHDGMVIDATTVIAKLGDFSTIRSPARCAARIGQAFSNTDGAVKIPPAIVRIVSDIERNGRTFSDGVGTISREVLAILWRDYPRARKSKPTLYHIRFKGAKGMISLDDRLTGKIMVLRKSMVKYTGSPGAEIELCGSASRPLPMYLNRQFIKIMEDLGVPPETFIQLQDDAVEHLRRTTLSPANAANFLEREQVGKMCRVPWMIRKLDALGVDFRQDSFLRQILELAVLSQLREVKHRSRIFVEQGITLYGIMDETGILPEGSIYCSTDKHVILGNVTITRAPALHPGDVQIATGVDVPDDSPLSHLHNCVVFSQNGDRDLPSQLSGGDLDGDLYNVIYDPRLLPPRVVEPADYPRVPPRDIGRNVTRRDMTEFFIDFMENDQLGRIAMLHMQLADRLPGGTHHADCKGLAELHSTAVDFSKTGIPADMSKLPKHDRCRPDFMAPGPRVTAENGLWDMTDNPLPNITEGEEDPVEALDPDTPRYRYYESDKVLGRLYRAIDERSFLAELQRRAREVEESFFTGETLVHRVWAYVQRESSGIQWEHYREWAYDIKEAYETQVIETIYQYSQHSVLISEVEVFVGALLGKDGGARTKQVREMSTSMKEQFERDAAYTINCIVHGSDEAIKGGEDEALERSIACLAVAMEESPTEWERVRRLESFRYVSAAICLGQLERLHRDAGFSLRY